jgi:hypothetical protein
VQRAYLKCTVGIGGTCTKVLFTLYQSTIYLTVIFVYSFKQFRGHIASGCETSIFINFLFRSLLWVEAAVVVAAVWAAAVWAVEAAEAVVVAAGCNIPVRSLS